MFLLYNRKNYFRKYLTFDNLKLVLNLILRNVIDVIALPTLINNPISISISHIKYKKVLEPLTVGAVLKFKFVILLQSVKVLSQVTTKAIK